MTPRHIETSHPSQNDANDHGHDMWLKDISLNDLLARFDPENHKHVLLLDDKPVGKEAI